MQRDRQCTYNVTLRRVRATIVVVEKQWILHILSVYVALDIEHAVHMCHIVICGLPRSKIFFRIILQKARFSEKVTEQKMWVSSASTRYAWKKRVRYDKKCILSFFFQFLTKIELCRQIFENTQNITFNENPSSGSQEFPCGRTDGQDRLTDMTTLIVAFRNFVKTPKNCAFLIRINALMR